MQRQVNSSLTLRRFPALMKNRRYYACSIGGLPVVYVVIPSDHFPGRGVILIVSAFTSYIDWEEPICQRTITSGVSAT
jgi:hypothetical protein